MSLFSLYRQTSAGVGQCDAHMVAIITEHEPVVGHAPCRGHSQFQCRACLQAAQTNDCTPAKAMKIATPAQEALLLANRRQVQLPPSRSLLLSLGQVIAKVEPGTIWSVCCTADFWRSEKVPKDLSRATPPQTVYAYNCPVH